MDLVYVLAGVFALWYCLSFVVCIAYFAYLTEMDEKYRYANPKHWRIIWLFILPPAAAIWIGCGIVHGFLPLAINALWIAAAYCCAKFPPIQIMGGQDARMLMSIGYLTPTFMIGVPLTFCAGIVLSQIYKKIGPKDRVVDWVSRGRPMVYFLSVGWMVSLALWVSTLP